MVDGGSIRVELPFGPLHERLEHPQDASGSVFQSLVWEISMHEEPFSVKLMEKEQR